MFVARGHLREVALDRPDFHADFDADDTRFPAGGEAGKLPELHRQSDPPLPADRFRLGQGAETPEGTAHHETGRNLPDRLEFLPPHFRIHLFRIECNRALRQAVHNHLSAAAAEKIIDKMLGQPDSPVAVDQTAILSAESKHHSPVSSVEYPENPFISNIFHFFPKSSVFHYFFMSGGCG